MAVQNTAKTAVKSKNNEKAYRESRRSSLGALFEKEMSDHLRSRRIIIIIMIIMVATIASIYGAVNGISDAISSDSHFIFLK